MAYLKQPKMPRVSKEAWQRAASERLRSSLVNGFMMLTAEGEALAAQVEDAGIPIPDLPAPKGSLIKPIARWFAVLTAAEIADLRAKVQAHV